MKSLNFLYLLIFLFSISFITKGQDSTKTADQIDFSDDIGLEDLMNVKLTVASQKELSIEQTPAIVSVLTKDDIIRSASKDMTDILRLIPGFEFTGDVNSEIGLGVRGITATEGKVLVMIDGLQMNENMYGTNSWIGRFDINQIEKIEIIRGPGYAAYNGFAGLGVINIITKKAQDIQGVEVHGTYSRLERSVGRQQISITTGFKKNDFSIKGSIYTGGLYRSEGIFTDLDSQKIVMNENKNNWVQPLQGYLVANYKKLEVKYFHENYNTTTPFYLDVILKKPGMSNFHSRQFDAQYKQEVTSNWTLTPRINYTYSQPYTSTDYIDTTISNPGYFLFDHDNYRLTTTISSQYKFSESFQFNAGIGYFHDKAETHLKSYNPTSAKNDSVLATYYDLNDYMELFFQKPSYTVSVGARHEFHNVFGNVFLPRFAATKQFDKFNVKAAYSHAFRAPLAENILINPTIKPEITKVAEIQVSYKPTKHVLLSVNVFDNFVSNVIVYDVINTKESYFNFKNLGTRGIESELLIQYSKFTFGGNYSYYIKTKNDVAKYQAANADKLIGFAPHKFTFSSKYNFTDHLQLSSSLIILGGRYAYTYLDSLSEPAQTELKPTAILNTTLSFTNFKNKGFSLQIGAFDLLNSGYVYAQGYNGGKAPFRATGREISMKLSYTFSKK
jgi:outer membrane cobalamin receptor